MVIIIIRQKGTREIKIYVCGLNIHKGMKVDITILKYVASKV